MQCKTKIKCWKLWSYDKLLCIISQEMSVLHFFVFKSVQKVFIKQTCNFMYVWIYGLQLEKMNNCFTKKYIYISNWNIHIQSILQLSKSITRAETENSKAYFIQDYNVLIHKIDFFHLLINECLIKTFSSQRPATWFSTTRFWPPEKGLHVIAEELQLASSNFMPRRSHEVLTFP